MQMRSVECGVRNENRILQFRTPHSAFRTRKGAWGDLNPPLRPSQGRVLPLHHTHHHSQRKERESNPQGSCEHNRLPTGPRRQSGGPSVIVSTPTRS